jgi:hypothetical protein
MLIPVERLTSEISPNPLPFVNVKDPELVTEVRRLNCRYYNDCLRTAYRRSWEGFHCNDCLNYSPYPISEDFEGCAELVRQLSDIAPFNMDDDEVIKRLGRCFKDVIRGR